jgi:hypothetical protein
LQTKLRVVLNRNPDPPFTDDPPKRIRWARGFFEALLVHPMAKW